MFKYAVLVQSTLDTMTYSSVMETKENLIATSTKVLMADKIPFHSVIVAAGGGCERTPQFRLVADYSMLSVMTTLAHIFSILINVQEIFCNFHQYMLSLDFGFKRYA